MNTQPEALELAELFDRGGTTNALHNAAAEELRRLHEENKNQTVDWDVLRERYDCLMIERNHLHSLNQELVEALDWCVAEINRDSPACLNGRAVLDKARGPE